MQARDKGSRLRYDPRGVEIAFDTLRDVYHENTAPIVLATRAHGALIADRLVAYATYANEPDELQEAFNKLVGRLTENIQLYASLTTPQTAPQLGYFLALAVGIARELQGQGDDVRAVLTGAHVVAGNMKSGFAPTLRDVVERALGQHDEPVSAEDEKWDSGAILDGFMHTYSA